MALTDASRVPPPPAEQAAPIAPGTLLGRVRLESVVGRGATATVYRGRHVHLGTEVAVKVMEARPGHGDGDRNRFLREARVAARLRDPGIVQVFDFGEYGDSCYLVMEYVDGVTLEGYLERHPEPVAEVIVLRLLRRVARALRSAHAAGLVHRDLKPANLLISRAGQLKVADFGLTRGSGEPATGRDGMFKGTPAYMAPESATTGARVDQRADLYALGVIAYELAFGRLPYEGSLQEVLQAHRRGAARFDLPSQCSARVVAVIRRLMAPLPEARIQNADELLSLLEPTTPSVGTSITSDLAPDARTGAAGSDDFTVLVRFLEDRFGGRVSEHEQGRVVHSTLRERLLVWVLLAATIGLAIAGYIVF